MQKKRHPPQWQQTLLFQVTFPQQLNLQVIHYVISLPSAEQCNSNDPIHLEHFKIHGPFIQIIKLHFP